MQCQATKRVSISPAAYWVLRMAFRRRRRSEAGVVVTSSPEQYSGLKPLPPIFSPVQAVQAVHSRLPPHLLYAEFPAHFQSDDLTMGDTQALA